MCLSVLEQQQQRRTGPMTQGELLGAVEAAVAATGRPVGTDEVRDQLLTAGRTRSRDRVSGDLSLEARRADTRLVRVSRGRYLVSGQVDDGVPTGAATHVLEAFRRLAMRGTTTLPVRELQRELGAMGLTYSQRAVYTGLENLRAPRPPMVEKLRPGAWALTEAGRQLCEGVSFGTADFGSKV